MPELSTGTIVWLVLVAILGIGTALRLSWWMRKTERERRKSLARRKNLDALKSDTTPDTRDKARDRAIESIEQHYTVTRRMLVPVVLSMCGLLAAIPFLSEVPASLVSVVVAAVTIFLGVALRPMAENAFAGLVLAQSRQLSIGDTVWLEDRYGIVEDITFTHTTVKIWDWRRLVIPNSLMLQKIFINYSLHDPYIWACTEVWVSRETDLDRVQALATEAAKKSSRFAAYEDPRFWVMEMTKDGILIWIAAWADTPADGWLLTADIRTELIKAFQREGIRGHVQHVALSRDRMARIADELNRGSRDPSVRSAE